MRNNKSKDKMLEEINKILAYDATFENETDTQKFYTLREITNEEFDILGKKDMKEELYGTDAKKIWYIQRFKQLIEILSCLKIQDEFKKLKKVKTYSFSKRNKEFILLLFKEYDGKLDSLRRGQINASDGSFYMELYTGILDIFYDSKADKETIESVMLKLWNRLDIPQIKLESRLDSVFDECKKMVNKNIDTPSVGMGMSEKLYWEMAFRLSFENFIKTWDNIFDRMSSIRSTEVFSTEEISAAAEKENPELTQIEFLYSEELIDAYEKDTHLQNLEEELCKLSGKKQKKLLRDVEKEFIKLTKQINDRRKEIKCEFISKHIPDFSFPDGYDEDPDYNPMLMSFTKLLDLAIQDEIEDRYLIALLSKNDILRRMKLYFP